MTLKQRAYENILERIMNEQYAQGALLNRRGVAKDLNISSAPAHEAMIQL